MKRLLILYLTFLISASFDQVQGTFMPYPFFPLSDLTMILPEYLSWITKLLGVSLIMWDMALQEKEYPIQMKIAAWLTTGFLADFILECTQARFDIVGYAFGYRSLVFIVFGIVIFLTLLKKYRHYSYGF